MIAPGSTGAPDPDAEAETGEAGRARPKKAPNAFRTISEVADELHIPQHVLRFWETKFIQVKPLKRGGGRRYYRPDDITLLRRISDLLYIQGYTIKGVQRLLREGGGKLSDDIPPPAPDERATDEQAPPANPELPLPGLPPRAGEPPRPGERAGPAGAEAAAAAAAEHEVARLRAVLAHTLAELRALRSLLG